MNGSVTYEGSTLLSGSINVNAGGNIEALNVQVTENGTRTIEASSGVDGYSPITIETNVPIPEPELDSITITENGTYTPPSGTDGYDEITVNVPSDTPNIQSLTTTISSNGVTTLHASDVNCDGFDPVTIRTEVPEPVLTSKTITANGTYTPESGTDGYDEVVVNVPVPKNYLSRPGFFQLNNEADSVNSLVQTSMDAFNTTWSGAPNIGFCLLGNIPLSGYNRLSFSIEEVGRNYQYVNASDNRNFNLAFVITDVKLSNFPQIIQLDANNNILAIKEYNGTTVYGQAINDYIDLSNISGNYYINFFMYGYNLTGVKFDIS